MSEPRYGPAIPGSQVVVLSRPQCDVCRDGTEAHYDAKTFQGPWAFLCEAHFKTWTLGRLGMGVGQRLLTPEEVGRSATGRRV